MNLPARLLLLPALHACMASADDRIAQPELAVGAETATVTVAPQPAERHFFDLPSLDYVFHVEAHCHEWNPESLSLNVADSRVTRNAAQLSGNASQMLELSVPARQLAPIAMRDFCVIGDAEEGSPAVSESPTTPGGPGRLQGNHFEANHMTISAVVSAHASLRCSSGDVHKTIYVSQPLDVSLTCELPESPGNSASP